jgi:translation initiation factor 2 beta subunit (eIF-2beta)/eIF-5
MYVTLGAISVSLIYSINKQLIIISDPTKYFGCELGAQTNFDLKNERYIVNGEHDANRLQDILDGFIRKFVLCTACDNPETTLVSNILSRWQSLFYLVCAQKSD